MRVSFIRPTIAARARKVMGRLLPIDVDLPYPACPHCRSVRGRIVPVADPTPNAIYLYCDDCHEVWTVRAVKLASRICAPRGGSRGNSPKSL